ncbi:coiled-coil domain-containing protein, partial [Anaplasma bovis]|uniref:hypothetical protein n=1 Tax=Anaplasma bovis TaxID=186733 RepID=UPI002FEF6D3C
MTPVTRNSTTHSTYSPYIDEVFGGTPLDSMGTLIEQDIDHEARRTSYSSLGEIFSQGVRLSYKQAAPKALYTSCAILSASLNTWVYCVALAVNSVYRIAHYDRLYNVVKGIFIKHSEEASTNKRLLTKIKEVAVKIFLSPILVLSATILTLVSVITIALGAVTSVIVPAISPIFLALFAMQALVTVVGNTLTTSKEVYTHIRDRVLGVGDSVVPDVDADSQSQDEQQAAEFTQSIFRKIAASISGAATAVFLMPIQLCLSLPSVTIPPALGALLTPVMLMSSLFNIQSLNRIFYGMSTLVNPKRTIEFDGKEFRTDDLDELDLILRMQGISPSALRNTYRELRATGIEREFFTQTSRYAKRLDALKAKVRQLKFAAKDAVIELERAGKVCERNATIVEELEADLRFIRAGDSSVQQSRTSSKLLKAEAELSASEKKLEELQTRRGYIEHKIYKAELRMFSISSAIAVIRKNLWERAFLTARENVSAFVPSVESAILKNILATNNVVLARRDLLEAESNLDEARKSFADAQSQFYAAKFNPQAAEQEGEQEVATTSSGDESGVVSDQRAKAEQDLNRAKESLDACLEGLEVAKKNLIAAEAKKQAVEEAEARTISKYTEVLRKRDKIGIALEKSRIEEYKNKISMYGLIEARDIRDIPGIQKSKIPITEKEKEFIREYLNLSSENISSARVVIGELQGRLEDPTYYESVVLAHRKNLLLQGDNVAITRADSKDPETASILDAKLMLLPSARADCELKSAEASYKNSLKKLSDIDARIIADDRLSHSSDARMARLEVDDTRALYNLALREKDLVSAQEKIEQYTKLYDASVEVARNTGYIASVAQHDLNFILSAAPENEEEISIASDRLRKAKEEAGEAKLVVEQNAELLKEAQSELNSIKSTLHDAKRARLEASYTFKSAMIEQSKTSPEHVLSEKEKYALDEAHVLASDAHRNQIISDICSLLCDPHEKDASFSDVTEQKMYETCSDIAESIQKKRIDMYNAHQQAHESEKRFLLYVYNKVENDLSYAESLAALARESESRETRDSAEGYDQVAASLRDLSNSARIAVSAMQVLSDQIAAAHDVHSYQLTTQRMISAAYTDIAQIHSRVHSEKGYEEKYDIAYYGLTNTRIKLSRLAARHCSSMVEECMLRYKYENTEQLKALASSNVKRISSMDLINKAQAGTSASSQMHSGATVEDDRAHSESLHESAYLLYDVANLIEDSCSFSDNIIDTVDNVCKKLCKAFEELERAKALLGAASQSEENAAMEVYKDAVR